MKTRETMQIVLASASPRRLDLLRQVGIDPKIIPSHVDESGVTGTPEQIVCQLSARKAEDVAAALGVGKGVDGVSNYTEIAQVIIGADTVVAADGQILGKPKSMKDAIHMIKLLEGRKHHVFTGVTMIFAETGERLTFYEATEVEVCGMNIEQIERYVATGEPMDKAGAYGIQGLFAAYIKGIHGDYNNVVGLPVGRICQELLARNLY